MFVRRRAPGPGRPRATHQLLESYRDAGGRTRHRVVAALGGHATVEAALESARAELAALGDRRWNETRREAGRRERAEARVGELERALKKLEDWRWSPRIADREMRRLAADVERTTAHVRDLDNIRLAAALAEAEGIGAPAPSGEAERLEAEVIELAGKDGGLEYMVDYLRRELKAERDRAFKAEDTLRTGETRWAMEREVLESLIRLWQSRAGPQKPAFEDTLTPEARARWKAMQASPEPGAAHPRVLAR